MGLTGFKTSWGSIGGPGGLVGCFGVVIAVCRA